MGLPRSVLIPQVGRDCPVLIPQVGSDSPILIHQVGSDPLRPTLAAGLPSNGGVGLDPLR